jgi:hypothetical protein
MNTTHTARFAELMKMKDEFNANLKDSFAKYELNNKQHDLNIKENHKIDKSRSSIVLGKKKILPKLNRPISKQILSINEEISNSSNRSIKRINSEYKKVPDTWKPEYMICDYFDKFRRLQDRHDMDNWEKVILYNLIILL